MERFYDVLRRLCVGWASYLLKNVTGRVTLVLFIPMNKLTLFYLGYLGFVWGRRGGQKCRTLVFSKLEMV